MLILGIILCTVAASSTTILRDYRSIVRPSPLSNLYRFKQPNIGINTWNNIGNNKAGLNNPSLISSSASQESASRETTESSAPLPYNRVPIPFKSSPTSNYNFGPPYHRINQLHRAVPQQLNYGYQSSGVRNPQSYSTSQPHTSATNLNRHVDSAESDDFASSNFENLFKNSNSHNNLNNNHNYYNNEPGRLIKSTDPSPPQSFKSYPLNQEEHKENQETVNFPSFEDFDFTPFSSFQKNSPNTQSQGGISNNHNPALKTNFSPLKSGEPQSFSSEFSSSPMSTAQHSEKSHHPNTQTVEINGKKIDLPVLELQTANGHPQYLHYFENQPLMLRAPVDYQNQPPMDFPYAGNAAQVNLHPQANSVPFPSSPVIGFQAQVVPIHTGNAQFPQYRGATVGAISPNYQKLTGAYTPLQSQPQLHFTTQNSLRPLNNYEIIHRTKPAEEVRDDVEIVNKKKNPPPPSRDDEEEDDDEGYRSNEREYPDDDSHNPPPPKKLSGGSHEDKFEAKKSHAFKAYDEKFKKNSKKNHAENDDEERPQTRYQSYTTSSSNGDDDNGSKESEENHSSKYESDYTSSRPQYSKDETDAEEEGESESRDHETHQTADHDPDYELPKNYKPYGKHIEREYEDSYKKDVPVRDYKHVKGVPEIDESEYVTRSSRGKGRSASRAKRGKKKYRRSSVEEEPQNEESRHFSKHRKLLRNDTHLPRNKKSSKILNEESFEFEVPNIMKKLDLKENIKAVRSSFPKLEKDMESWMDNFSKEDSNFSSLNIKILNDSDESSSSFPLSKNDAKKSNFSDEKDRS